MTFDTTISTKAISIGTRAIFNTLLKRWEIFLSEDETISFWISKAIKTSMPTTARELVKTVAVAVDTVEVVTTVEIIILFLKKQNYFLYYFSLL